MNKKIFASFMFGAALCVCITKGHATAVDEKLFLEPHLAHLADKAVFQAGTVLSTEQKHTFEHALSKNIGMHLPSTLHVVSQDACRVTGLAAHIHTIADSLKDNGVAIITAPASYAVVFTVGNGSKEEVAGKINQALEKIGSSDDVALITSALSDLKEVTRATFVKRNGKLQLVTSEKMLSLGESVWRKNPEGVSQEIFHSEEEFLVAIKEAGLFCEEIKRPCFFGQVKWEAYNKQLSEGQAPLGQAYKDYNPFTIYKVVKKAA